MTILFSDLKQKIVLLSKKSIGGLPVILHEEINPEIKNPRLTNLVYLRELSENNDAFYRDFINLFLSNTPETLIDLHTQLNLKNWEGVRQAAHKMKPSLNYLGLKDGQKIAAEIEEYAYQKTYIERINGLAEKLTLICNAAFAELEEELKTIPTT